MTSKKTLSPRKEELLKQGKLLILSKGYTATTVDAIVEAVGITKGAFYYFFKSKDEFARELLDYNWLPVRHAQEELRSQNIDPLQHLYQHIDFMVEFVPEHGRLMGIISNELSESHPEISKQMQGFFREWTEYLEEIITLTKAQYGPNSNIVPKNLMEFILMTLEGAPVVSRQLGTDAVNHAVEHLKAYIQSLFTP
jgi:TetR/AcrR family transcriptional regulator, transcriptional repressor for nem operon